MIKRKFRFPTNGIRLGDQNSQTGSCHGNRLFRFPTNGIGLADPAGPSYVRGKVAEMSFRFPTNGIALSDLITQTGGTATVSFVFPFPTNGKALFKRNYRHSRMNTVPSFNSLQTGTGIPSGYDADDQP